MATATHTPVLTAQEAQVAALRQGIAAMLAECSPEAVAGFHRIHDNAPWKGFDNCPDRHLSASYDLVGRTLRGERADLAKAGG